MSKKRAIKPMFPLKHDFVESLDFFLQRAITLHQVLRTALELGQVAEPVAAKLREQLDAFDAALFSKDDGP